MGGKPGRPRGKPLSAVERAQRRTAALRHGRHATSPWRQTVPACKRSSCPLHFPCEVRRLATEAGRGVEVCVVTLMSDDDVRQRYLEAMETGDPAVLRELAATAMAGLYDLHARSLDDLRREGFSVSRPVATKGGEVLDVPMTHPAAFPTLELGKQLGLTADQLALTPKSRGETQRNVSEAQHLDWMRRMRERLVSPEGEA